MPGDLGGGDEEFLVNIQAADVPDGILAPLPPIQRRHGTQDTQHDGRRLPADQVIWPQAAAGPG